MATLNIISYDANTLQITAQFADTSQQVSNYVCLAVPARFNMDFSISLRFHG